MEAAAFAGADVDDEPEDDEPEPDDEDVDDESDDVLVAGFDESDPDFDPLSLLADPLDAVDVDEVDDLLSFR